MNGVIPSSLASYRDKEGRFNQNHDSLTSYHLKKQRLVEEMVMALDHFLAGYPRATGGSRIMDGEQQAYSCMAILLTGTMRARWSLENIFCCK